jgi:hypothetical protein
MEERQVSVDGTTYLLEPPFVVVATQNPIEMEDLSAPEAQRTGSWPASRWISDAEFRARHAESGPQIRWRAATGNRRCCHPGLIEAVKRVYVSPAVKHYIVQVVNAAQLARSPAWRLAPRDVAVAPRQPRLRCTVRSGLRKSGRRRSSRSFRAGTSGVALHRCPACPPNGDRCHRSGDPVCAHS